MGRFLWSRAFRARAALVAMLALVAGVGLVPRAGSASTPSCCVQEANTIIGAPESTYYAFSGSDWVGSDFETSATENVVQVTVAVARVDCGCGDPTVGDLSVALWHVDASGKPTTPIIGTPVPDSTVPADGTLRQVDVTFTPAPLESAGTPLAVVLSTTGGGGANVWRWYNYAASEPQTIETSSDGGQSWASFTQAPSPTSNYGQLGFTVWVNRTNPQPPTPLTMTPQSFSLSEGQASTAVVATINDPNVASASDIEAWVKVNGDTIWERAAITQTAPQTFAVRWTHNFPEEGPEHIQIEANDVTTFDTASVSADGQVDDSPLSASPTSLTGTEAGIFSAATPASGMVATFADADPQGTTVDYSATIDWGDGHRSAGTIGASGAGFSVSGSHTYAEDGHYDLTVTINDTGGASTTTTSHATINDPSNPIDALGETAKDQVGD